MLRNLSGSDRDRSLAVVGHRKPRRAGARKAATSRGAGTAMASCPATARPSGSNWTRRAIASRSIGMAARASIAGAGTAAASVRAGPRPRSEMSGTAASSGQRSSERRTLQLPSLADRDPTYPPAVARHHAPANRIANALVPVIGVVTAIAIIGVAIIAVIRQQPEAEAKPKSHAAAPETAAAETAAKPPKPPKPPPRKPPPRKPPPRQAPTCSMLPITAPIRRWRSSHKCRAWPSRPGRASGYCESSFGSRPLAFSRSLPASRIRQALLSRA